MRVALHLVLIEHRLLEVGAPFGIKDARWILANALDDGRLRTSAARFTARREPDNFPHEATPTVVWAAGH